MKKEGLKQKKADSAELYFFSNLSDIQLISGITAFSAVIITIIAMIFLPTKVDKALTIYIAIFVSAFILIYYTTPKLYLSSRLMLLPDAVFTIAITLVMFALKEFGEFYLIFFILLIAIDAFAFRLRDFIIVVLMVISALTFANFILAREYFTMSDLIFRYITQIYSIIVVSIVMRSFAKEALGEKKEKEQIRRLAESTLLAIKQMRNLLDNIGNGIFATDENQKIILTNTAAVNILGWEKAIVGKKLNEVITFYNADMQRVDPVNRVMDTKKPVNRNDLVMIRGEETTKLYVNVTPILSQEEEIQGAIVLFRDITKEKELEEQRLEFVAVSSHELRTPLTIIEGYLYHILNEKKLKYDRKTKLYIEKAHSGCLELQRLIIDLLEVSKLEQKKMKFILEKVDVKKLVLEVISDFKKKVSESGLELILEIKQKSLPLIFADREKLKEVLMNLITNALKFTEQGYIKIKILKENGYLKFAIEDTGEGITKEDQKFIFNKFYRVEGWKTRKTGGTGLGLYITKNIIEKFRGRIWVESRFGKGSTFYVTIPINFKNSKIVYGKPKKETGELKEFVSKL